MYLRRNRRWVPLIYLTFGIKSANSCVLGSISPYLFNQAESCYYEMLRLTSRCDRSRLHVIG